MMIFLKFGVPLAPAGSPHFRYSTSNTAAPRQEWAAPRKSSGDGQLGSLLIPKRRIRKIKKICEIQNAKKCKYFPQIRAFRHIPAFEETLFPDVHEISDSEILTFSESIWKRTSTFQNRKIIGIPKAFRFWKCMFCEGFPQIQIRHFPQITVLPQIHYSYNRANIWKNQGRKK